MTICNYLVARFSISFEVRFKIIKCNYKNLQLVVKSWSCMFLCHIWKKRLCLLVQYVYEFLSFLPKDYTCVMCSWVFKVIKEKIMLVRYVMNNPFMSECSHISVHFVEIRKSNFPVWTLQWQKCQWSKILVIHVSLLHLISWYQNHS